MSAQVDICTRIKNIHFLGSTPQNHRARFDKLTPQQTITTKVIEEPKGA